MVAISQKLKLKVLVGQPINSSGPQSLLQFLVMSRQSQSYVQKTFSHTYNIRESTRCKKCHNQDITKNFREADRHWNIINTCTSFYRITGFQCSVPIDSVVFQSASIRFQKVCNRVECILPFFKFFDCSTDYRSKVYHPTARKLFLLRLNVLHSKNGI